VSSVLATAPAPEDRGLSVLMVASEVMPFAKTGGLADVTGALPVRSAASVIAFAWWRPAIVASR
jgi:hypothetical protein